MGLKKGNPFAFSNICKINSGCEIEDEQTLKEHDFDTSENQEIMEVTGYHIRQYEELCKISKSIQDRLWNTFWAKRKISANEFKQEKHY